VVAEVVTSQHALLVYWDNCCGTHLVCEVKISHTLNPSLTYALLLPQAPPTAVIAARLLRTVAADVHSRAAAAGLEPLLQEQYIDSSSKTDSHTLLPPPPPLIHSTKQSAAVFDDLWGSSSNYTDSSNDSIHDRLQAARAAHGEALRDTLRRCDAHMLHETHWL
jgi:hypothetical protein